MAATQISGGFIVGAILVSLVMQLLTAVIASIVSSRVLKARVDDQVEAVATIFAKIDTLADQVGALKDKLADKVGGLKVAIDQVDKERVTCARDAGREYASRAEVYRLSVDQSANQQQILSRIDELARTDEARAAKVHERINKIGNDVSRMKGQLEGKTDG